MPTIETPTTDIADPKAAFDQARAALRNYVDTIETAHREQHPNPVGADGRPKWSEAQALQRTAAWTDEEHVRLAELRNAEHDAVMALHRAKQAAAEAEDGS